MRPYSNDSNPVKNLINKSKDIIVENNGILSEEEINAKTKEIKRNRLIALLKYLTEKLRNRE